MDETRKKQIISAAFQHFIRSGYDATSLTDIADSLKITKPALYYYFKNKDELYREAYLYFIEEMGKMFMDVITTDEGIEQTLRNSFCSLQNIFDYYSSLLNLPYSTDQIFLKTYFYIYDAIARLPEAAEIMKSIYSNAITSLAEKLKTAQEKSEIRRDIDPDSFSLQLNATIEGTLLLSIFIPGLNLDEVGKKMFDNIWQMIKK